MCTRCRPFRASAETLRCEVAYASEGNPAGTVAVADGVTPPRALPSQVDACVSVSGPNINMFCVLCVCVDDAGGPGPAAGGPGREAGGAHHPRRHAETTSLLRGAALREPGVRHACRFARPEDAGEPAKDAQKVRRGVSARERECGGLTI